MFLLQSPPSTSPATLTVDLATVLNAVGIIIIAIASFIVQRKQAASKSKPVLDPDDVVRQLSAVTLEKTRLQNEVEDYRRKDGLELKPSPIMYVEDDLNDAELLRRVFVSAGISNEFIWVDSPEAAYAKMREREILVVIINLKMLSNGHRMLMIMKEDPRLRDIPVVVLSGSEPENIQIYQEGALCFLVKPFDIEQFLRCLNRHGFSWILTREQ